MDLGKIKEEVLEIIKDNNSCFINDDQYAFAAGLIVNFLEGCNFRQEMKIKIRKEHRAYILKQNRFINLGTMVKKLVKDNFEIAMLAKQNKKNLFAYFFAYTPEKERLSEDQSQLLILGHCVPWAELDN